MKKTFPACIIFLYCVFSQANGQVKPPGEHLCFDFDWRFAFGHPYNTALDFNTGTASFSYFAKAGYGDGAAAPDFDDRSWRKLDLPHDWAVEQPFSENGSYSHGFKAIGRNFPGASIGWYRKKFMIPAKDSGRHISIAFDGVFRNSMVWVNGFYLGTQQSGYLGFEYDISAYLNYGEMNTVAVRADAGMEEGWFYEGAGIYRHVWLNKTAPLHVARDGSFVTSKVDGDSATLQVSLTVSNRSLVAERFNIVQQLLDQDGAVVGTATAKNLPLRSFAEETFKSTIPVTTPVLWSVDHPYLYRLKSMIQQDGNTIDSYETAVGIRTIRFDPNEGFFLNGKSLKIKGTNNHQDHAGVGTAIPDDLYEYRIRTLKSFGCNAYRCSHNPPAPELLDACDRLGMLVIDENRLAGITQTQLGDLEQMIRRDRNHPCIISWSIGNEEWQIENNRTGARIASTMQGYVRSIDSTRPATYAFSGGIGSDGITTVMGLIGINYIANKNTDEEHRLFPGQCIWGTEEGSTNATRGAYYRDDAKHIIPAYDKPPNDFFLTIEKGWKHYATRPYLAGMFIWTGFDYRGEPTPYGWPSTGSYFGMVDLCGFRKDDAWYLQSWWTLDTVLHILPHWNWKGKEGTGIEVWTYSNCDEVELFLNKKSLGTKKIPLYGHAEWMVPYQQGVLEAAGYRGGKLVTKNRVTTTGSATGIALSPGRKEIAANRTSIAMVTVSALDSRELEVPAADNEITFSIEGPGKIIGVGNGNPTSLEADRFIESIREVKIENLLEKAVDNIYINVDSIVRLDASAWQPAFTDDRTKAFSERTKAVLYRGTFDMPVLTGNETITFFYDSLGPAQTIYINGKLIAKAVTGVDASGYSLNNTMVHPGENNIMIVATPFVKAYSWSTYNKNPGLVQVLTPAPPCKRKLFNGLAQVIVQSTGEAGTIRLSATAAGLKTATTTINCRPAQ